MLNNNRSIERAIESWLAVSEFKGKVSLDYLKSGITTHDFISTFKYKADFCKLFQEYSILILNTDNNTVLNNLVNDFLGGAKDNIVFYPTSLKLGVTTNNCFSYDVEDDGLIDILELGTTLLNRIANKPKYHEDTFDFLEQKLIQEGEEEVSSEGSSDLDSDLPYDSADFLEHYLNGDVMEGSLSNSIEAEGIPATDPLQNDTINGEVLTMIEKAEKIEPVEVIFDYPSEDQIEQEEEQTTAANDENVIDEAVTAKEAIYYKDGVEDSGDEVPVQEDNEQTHIIQPRVIHQTAAPEQQSEMVSAKVANIFSKEPLDTTQYLQRSLFSFQKIENNKSIALWSPLPRMGVTNFAINFACFLAENRVRACVLEGIRGDNKMKHIMRRYSNVPANWRSYAQNINDVVKQNVNDETTAEWKYRNVLFLPLDDTDANLSWSYGTLEAYFTAPQIMDVILIDLPSGEMSIPTSHALSYINELWVLVDDTFQEIVAWKNYIHYLKQNYNIEVKLIFSETYDFSETKRLAEAMELPLLGELPAMHEHVMRNYYETQPVFYNKKGGRQLLFEPYKKIAEKLLGDDFETITTAESDKQFAIGSNLKVPSWPTIWEIIKTILKIK